VIIVLSVLVTKFTTSEKRISKRAKNNSSK